MKAIGEMPGGVSTIFSVRFQNPSFAVLVEAAKALAAKFGLAAAPKTLGIEVSIDFYSRKASADARSRMVAVLARHLFPERNLISRERDQPRFTWGKGKQYTRPVWGKEIELENVDPIMNVETDRILPPDATFYVGEKGTSVMWRVMDKYLDAQDPVTGSGLVLPETERRARVEVTLLGSELQLHGAETWRVSVL